MNPIHRIDPSFLTVPQFYGSPGEPTLGRLPQVPGGNPNLSHQAVGGVNPMLLGLLASSAMMPGNAQAPVQQQQAKPEEQPNDEPIDVMPDYLKFGPAFDKARKMGLQVFTWRGRNYTTKLK